MHVPDGLIDAPTSAVAGAVAATGIAVSLRRAGDALEDQRIPIAGLTAAYVFAVQMLNFPVAAGTSGHLLGGALAAVLVGPWVGAICLTVVIVVQSVMFADGGLSALGLNVVNMALLGALGGWVVFRLARALLPPGPSSVALAAGVAGFATPVLAAALFTLEYAVGGNDAVSIGRVGLAMIGVHALIGIGEGVITAMTVSAVLASRPDLVHGHRPLAPAPGTNGLVGVEG